jgi:hypothetical protein
MDDSIEDLRETHTAIIARIEAEYEEKLKRIKEGNLFLLCLPFERRETLFEGYYST